MDDCENKEAAYEVLDFLLEDENIQTYLDDQKAVPCKEGDFTLPSTLDGMEGIYRRGKDGRLPGSFIILQRWLWMHRSRPS